MRIILLICQPTLPTVPLRHVKDSHIINYILVPDTEDMIEI